MPKTVCIVCGKEKAGHPVQEDPVLSTIRAAKERLGRATGNSLVVCGDDVEAARGKRERFEKYLMWYGLLAAAMFFLVLYSSRSLASIVVGALAAAFLLALSLVNYYPKAELPEKAGKAAETKA